MGIEPEVMVRHRADGAARLGVVGGGALAPAGEPLRKQGGALVSPHTRLHLDFVVQARIDAEVVERPAGTSFRICRTEDQPPDPSGHEGAGAHRAWLQRDVDGGVGEPPGPEAFGGLAEGENLGVGGGVLLSLPPIAGGRHNLRAGDHDRPDRDLALICRLAGFFQGEGHGVVVGQSTAFVEGPLMGAA